MTEYCKMIDGDLYHPSHYDLVCLRQSAQKKLQKFNALPADAQISRVDIIHDLFAKTGVNVAVGQGFCCDYGINIHVGDNFFANDQCVILDSALVTIGDDCLLGPQVGLYTACHPLDPFDRRTGVEFAKPITIGNHCWIGGHATINPGVTLGNNVVVASGSVVTKSFGDNLVIAGNPARVLREFP